MKKIILSLIISTTFFGLSAQTTTKYSFTDGTTNPSTNNVITGTPSSIQVFNENGSVTRVANVDPSDVVNSSSGNYIQASVSAVALNTGGANNTSTYFEISYAPSTPSTSISMSGISFDGNRGTTGPNNWALYSNQDSYTNPLKSGTLSDNWANESGAFTVVRNAGETLTFRIYFFNFGSNDPGPNNTSLRIDDLTFHTDISTLPITLKSFYVKAVDKEVLLNWTTASEKNNSHFNVLRSSDGKNFKKIKEIKGAGNSTNDINYSFVDVNPAAGTNYYKLQQVDFDGKSSSSDIKAVKSGVNSSSVSVYTSTNNVNLDINSANDTSADVYLFDVSGRKIGAQKVKLTKGSNNVSFSENLNPGVHFVRLVSDSEVIVQKFMR